MSDAEIIAAPVFDGEFDVLAGGEFAVERLAHEIGEFIVGRKTQRDDLADRQGSGARGQLGRQHALKP